MENADDEEKEKKEIRIGGEGRVEGLGLGRKLVEGKGKISEAC